MRALSSAIVFSLSSYLGGSMPASRAPPFLARSHALCTWRVNENISGKRRALSSTEGSIAFAAAYASALSRIAESALRPISNTGIDALDIDMAGSSLRQFGSGHHCWLAIAPMAAVEAGIARFVCAATRFVATGRLEFAGPAILNPPQAGERPGGNGWQHWRSPSRRCEG